MLRVITAASCPSASSHVASGLHSDLAQQDPERHAGPLALAGQRRQLAGRSVRRGVPPVVARALEEADARFGRETLQFVEREDGRSLYEPVDQQRVVRWVDLGHAAVVPLDSAGPRV
jgi:hypothetical protein